MAGDRLPRALDLGPLSDHHVLPPSLVASVVVFVVFGGIYYAATGRPLRGKSWGAIEMITLTTGIVFVLEGIPLHRLLAVVPPFYDAVLDHASLTPARYLAGEQWWAPFTKMFVHADIAHIFFNMLMFWLVGAKVEDRIGRMPFVSLYLITGLAATAVMFGALYAVPPDVARDSLFSLPSWNARNLGASGAVFGVLGFAIGAFPKDKVPVPTPFMILPLGPIAAAFILTIIEIFRAIGQPGIAWWAHLGGMSVGIVWGVGWRLRHPPPAEGPTLERPDSDGPVSLDDEALSRPERNP